MDRKPNLQDAGTGTGFVRLAGIAGVSFAVLILLSNLLLVPAGLPSPGSELDDVAAFFGGDHGVLRVVPAFSPVVWVAGTMFAAGAVAVLWRPDRERGEAWSLVGFAGVILQNGTFVALTATRFALGSTAAEDGGATAGFWALHDGLLTLNGTFLTLALTGLSISGLRSGLLPRWLGGAGFLAAFLQFSGAVLAPLVVTGAGALSLFGLAGWLIWVGWLAGYGTVLIRHASR